MATSFITYTKRGVAESSNLLATVAGHIENVLVEADNGIDNGSFISLGDFVSGDVWKAKAPAAGEDIYLVLSVPLIYEDYTSKMQEESNFFNGKGEVARAYQLFKRDKFALSAECFAANAEPAVGKYLTFSGFKAGVAASAPQSGPVMKIYDVATNGNFRVVVESL